MARIVWHDMDALQGATGGMPAPTRASSASNRQAARRLGFVAMLTRISTTLSLWVARHRQRELLAQLDARALRDIGITRYDAQRECEKPFWR